MTSHGPDRETCDLRCERDSPPQTQPREPSRDLFDVPEGYLPGQEAVRQILVLPGAIGLAGVLIALIASVARCS